jgi:hypothetical protein
VAVSKDGLQYRFVIPGTSSEINTVPSDLCDQASKCRCFCMAGRFSPRQQGPWLWHPRGYRLCVSLPRHHHGLPSRRGSRTASARSGDCAGSLRFPLAAAFKPTCEAVESGRRPDAAKAARRVPREARPSTGRGANLRARTGSVSGLTAVDVEDMAGDV